MCYTVVDAHDADQRGDTAAELKRRLAAILPDIQPCKTNRAGPSLDLMYQAGRGTCIDCELPMSEWSGFAFIVVTGEHGDELASAEWQGERAKDGHVLMQKFVDDLRALASSSRKDTRSLR